MKTHQHSYNVSLKSLHEILSDSVCIQLSRSFAFIAHFVGNPKAALIIERVKSIKMHDHIATKIRLGYPAGESHRELQTWTKPKPRTKLEAGS